MQTEGLSFCLLQESELRPAVQALQIEFPNLQARILPGIGTICIELSDGRAAEKLRKQFAPFFFSHKTIQEALHCEMIARGKKLALAESCTGGAMAAILTKIPEASRYFLGSLVVYDNSWKERFLQVSRSTLKKYGAVSPETVSEMLRGLFSETEADFAVAISGIAGPTGGTPQKPVGTIYIGIGQRGEAPDIGILKAPPDRTLAIDLASYAAIGALWRQLVHHTKTFS